jgi:F0F1-type ATP synthase membrane subunit b/b'
MISLNLTALLIALSFVLFMALMKRLFFDKVASTLQERENLLQRNRTAADIALAETHAAQLTITSELEALNRQLYQQLADKRHQLKVATEAATQAQKQQYLEQLKADDVAFEAEWQAVEAEAPQLLLPLSQSLAQRWLQQSSRVS